MDKYNIGKNEIQTMKLHQLYFWLFEKRNSQILIPSINFPISETSKQIHNDILPNYLKTFNYKLTSNLLLVEFNHILLLITKPICVH